MATAPSPSCICAIEKAFNMSFLQGLECREGKPQYANQPTHVCDNGFGPLDIRYDYDAIGNPAAGHDVIHTVRYSGSWPGRRLTVKERPRIHLARRLVKDYS